MPLFKIKSRHLKDYSVATEKFSNTAVIAFAQTLTPKVRLANTANSSYSILDDAAVNIGGGYIVLTGTGFQSGAQVLIGNTPVTSTSFVDSTTLRAEVPARAAGTYNLFVVNPDGGTSIRVNGVTYSSFPTFSTAATLANTFITDSFAINISASSDSNITYSNTTSLPTGTSLLANGYFYGAYSEIANTTFTFDVKATDTELQDSTRTFSVFVEVPKIVKTFAIGGITGSGELGLNVGSGNYRSSPTQIGALTDWNSFSTRDSATLAVKYKGTLWAWGYGIRNQLGLNDQINRSSPTQVGALTNWSKVKVGFNHTLAIKTDGTLWAWGSGNNGVLGTNNSTAVLSPVQIGSSTWLDIAAGVECSFAIKSDGTLWSWGDGTLGQLGLSGSITSLRRSSPVQVGALTDWATTEWTNRIVSAGQATLVVKPNGTLWGWGVNAAGRLGNNSVANASSPVQIGSSADWSYPVISGPHQGNEAETAMTICTKTNGTIWSWGSNTFGGLGRNVAGVGFGNSSNRSSSPVQIGTDTNWAQGPSKVAIGNFGNVGAIKTNGTLWLWGYNGYGTLGLNDKVYRSSPVQLGSGTTWSRVSSGDRFVIGQTTSSLLGFTTSATLPNQYDDVPIALNITATSGDSAITYSNTTSLPTGTSLLANGYFYGAVSVSSNTNYSFTIKATDDTLQETSRTFSMNVQNRIQLWGWGDGAKDILVQGVLTSRSSPTQIGTSPNWTKVSANKDTSYPGVLARKDDGTLWSWGVNSSGQLGFGSTSTLAGRSSPAQVGTDTNWTDNIMIRGTYAIAIKSDDTLWSWGNGTDGVQLNNTSGTDRLSPGMIASGSWIKASIGSTGAAAAIKTNGTLWTWGSNNYGQLGTNDRINKSSPVQVGTSTDWSDVVIDNAGCWAIKTDGTLWAWGNGSAYLGLNESQLLDRSSPVQVGTSTDWSKIFVSSGANAVAALKTNGTLWTWGSNSSGQLGQSKVTAVSSPVQIGTNTWTDVGFGSGYLAAVRSDGTLWAWGQNGQGQLGQNNRVNKSSPVQVGTNTNWYQVAGGIDYCFALTKN